MHPDESLAALRSLRHQHEGTLAFGDRRAPLRFVHDPRTFEIVAPVEPAVLKFESVVLSCPDEPVCHIQIMVAPREIERPESSALVDKWTAYHGKITARKWASCRVEGVKTGASVCNPDELRTPGLPPGSEHRLVKRANADRAALAAACARISRAEVADPLCVGIDDLGLDVRARFGIVRLEFDALCTSEESAAAAIDRILSQGTAA